MRPNLLANTGSSILAAAALCLAGATGMAAPSANAGLAAANNEFAFGLLKQVAQAPPPGKNVFLSPFSVSTVLQIVANGAAGETRTEMLNALQTAALPPDSLNPAFSNLNQSLTSVPEVTLNLANGIWYQSGIQLQPAFVAQNRNFYGAKLAAVDFSQPSAASLINQWADDSTHGKIPRVVDFPFPARTRVILANAIYFKGQWVKPFDKKLTQPHVFHLSGGDEQTPLMWQHGNFRYQESPDFQAIQLPYAGGRLQMSVFLPPTNSSPAALLATLNEKVWESQIVPRFLNRDGTLGLPKFKIEYEIVLNDALQALGMRQAFDTQADFSALANEPLYVSQVKQNSFVDVNEEGTEAAAVTTVTMKTLALMQPLEPFKMTVDRPFLFVISDRQTQSILFMGIISDPAPKP